MARTNIARKNIGELIDRIERMREELLSIQKSMEILESVPQAKAVDASRSLK